MKAIKKHSREIEAYLNDLVRKRVAPGFQLSIGYRNEAPVHFAVGRRGHARGKLKKTTLMDIASLTKVLSTSLLCLVAKQDSLIISFDEPLRDFFNSENAPSVRQLLEHRSGLPPLPPKIEQSDFRHEWKAQARAHFKSSAEQNSTYSDWGYILLGWFLEELFQKPLDQVFSALFSNRDDIGFRPRLNSSFLQKFWRSCAEVRDLESVNLVYEARSQDPRCFQLGGVAGHAGLWASSAAVDYILFEIYLAYHGKSLMISDQVARDLIRLPRQTDRFVGGWDTPTMPSQLGVARHTDAFLYCVGHLGYTGASCWMDIEQGWRISLLCHRHQMGDGSGNENLLAEERPKFHGWLREHVIEPLQYCVSY